MYGATSKLQFINRPNGETSVPCISGESADKRFRTPSGVKFMRPVALAGILASTTILGGCAATIGGISLSSISSFAGFASTLFTGADLGEHAASLITGKDCRFSEGLLREDRDICEEPGSLATRDDFHGIFVERIDPDGTVIFAAPKYMSAGIGAGENENNPETIWAAIKMQKAKEENERQLARVQKAQTIDVAALATGSVSSESLAFLPAGMAIESDFVVDGETASQTASGPRAIINLASVASARASVTGAPKAATVVKASEVKVREVKAPAAELPIDTDQPAIDEKALTAAAQTARATGAGGPLITTAASSAPVHSTLVNGEPVVVLRLAPLFAATPASVESVHADFASEETATVVAHASTRSAVTPAPAPSPLAVLGLKPKQVDAPTPAEVAAVEPQLAHARPRRKPRVEAETQIAKPDLQAVEVKSEVAEVVKPTRAKSVPASAGSDVYRPSNEMAKTTTVAAPAALAPLSSRDAAYSPPQRPQDVPAEPEPEPMTYTESAPAYEPEATPTAPAFAPSEATSGPAPLAPMPQE